MCNDMIPNMMPNMMMPNIQQMQPYQMGMPFNNMNYNVESNDINTRLNAIERQIRRINDRLTRLEAVNNNTYYNEEEEIDNNSIYLM